MARQLQEDMRETDTKKRELEDQLDQMNNDLASLKQQEQKAQGTLSLSMLYLFFFESPFFSTFSL